MTDFLTRMARSALGLTPLAKVLTASRYAPEPEMPEQAFEEMPLPRTVLAPPVSAHAIDTPAPERQTAEVQPTRPVVTVMRRAATVMAATPPEPPEGAERAHLPVTTDGVHDIVRHESAPPRQPMNTMQPVEESTPAPRSHRGRQPEGVSAPRSGRPNAAAPAGEGSGAQERPLDTDPTEHSLLMHDEEEVASPRHPAPRSGRLHAAPPAGENAGAPERPLDTDPIERSLFVRAGERPAPPWHPGSSPLDAPEPRQLPALSPTLTPADAPIAHSPSPRTSAPPLPARRDETAAETPAAPVIRVTIGRVEVRAATPPPPVEPPAPPAPRLSLDDYLRSHNGRAR